MQNQNNQLVYYVAYGSNMLEERFLTYIQGGKCRFNGKTYDGCKDHSMPLESIPVTIDYNMYFSKCSETWGDSAVCFLDVTKPGFAYGRAYLITEEQFKHIQVQEGIGWYGKVVELGIKNGHPMKTFTNELLLEHKSIADVNLKYLDVVKMGLKETHQLSDRDIQQYIEKCL